MEQPIVGFHQDEVGDWVADLACGHTQHVRHNPPFSNRPWVLTQEGRRRFLGFVLNCKLCDEEREQ
ncbi:MAG: GNAT family acetyltransferase [Anaerolineaceae bacterium]|nr:GNAT family acetyltransferase [Anaerolineaceae bacterium]